MADNKVNNVKTDNDIKEVKDAKDTKTRSFRVTEDTRRKINDIAKDIGGNQQAAFDKLLGAYQMEQGKFALPDMADAIDNFNAYANNMIQMYVQLVNDYKNTKNIVRVDFAKKLESKDILINDLQSQIETAKDLQTKSETALYDATKELDVVKRQLYDVTDKLSMQDKLIVSLQAQTAEIESLRAKQAEMDNLQVDLVASEQMHMEDTAKLKDLENQLERFKLEAKVKDIEAVRKAEDKIRNKYEAKLTDKDKEIKQLRVEIKDMQAEIKSNTKTEF